MMSVTDEDSPAVPAGDAVEELKASGALDALFAKIDAGEVAADRRRGAGAGADQGGARAWPERRADRSPRL